MTVVVEGKDVMRMMFSGMVLARVRLGRLPGRLPGRLRSTFSRDWIGYRKPSP